MKSHVAKLYVLATPIGNRGDITLRAKELLQTLSCYFAEDTREFRKLMQIFEIPLQSKVVRSLGQHNLVNATQQALNLLENGTDVGLVSDRGTPTVSDPGQQLIQACHERDIGVVPIPGVSAVVTALSASGFEASKFTFLGFLPHEKTDRVRLYEAFSKLQSPLCFFESPQRVRRTVRELRERFPSGILFWGREMTKQHETYCQKPLSEISDAHLPEKGEYTLVLSLPARKQEQPAETSLEDHVAMRCCTEREWSKRLAEKFSLSASEIYNKLQQAKR